MRDAIAGPLVTQHLAPDLVEVVRRALAFDAADRFASTRELQRAVAAARGARPPVDATAFGAWIAARA